jgi:phage tail protein X
MAKTITTKAGDMLDLIAYQNYGYRPGAIEAILEANFGLCEQPPILPAGLRLTIPDLPANTGRVSPIRLWD